MCKHAACVITAAAAVALAVGAVPAHAQSFLQGSPDTIWYGNVRLEGAPAVMWPHDGGHDSTGGAFRLGYGITSSFDLEAKSGFFDGVTLLGGDGHVRLYDRSDTLATLTVGGHHAFVRDALDSNALDVAASLGHWFSPRLQLYAGAAYSFEKLSGVPSGTDATFSRWYAVPGLRVGVASRVDLLVEGGVGLNHDSPHYVTAGFAFNMPVSDRAAGRTR
jgi:hypothetical protein